MNATRIVLDAFLGLIGYDGTIDIEPLPMPENEIVASDEREAFLSVYSPLTDTRMLKEKPCDFENLRNNYKLRREPSVYKFVLK
jgi:hypothetical protein